MNGEDSDGYAFSQASRLTAPDPAGYIHQPSSFFPRDLSSPSGNFSSDNFMENLDDETAANPERASTAEDNAFLAALTSVPVSTEAMSLIFPVQEQLDTNTWNMPGAFSTGDAMDLDHLPPFTVALDMYFDASTPSMYEDTANTAYKQSNASEANYQGMTRGMLDGHANERFLREESDYTATYNFQMAAPPSQSMLLNFPPSQLLQHTPNQSILLDLPAELPQSFSLDFQGLPGTDILTYSKNTPDQGLAHQPYFLSTNDYARSASSRRESLSHRLSILGNGADLLPLTTTTSLTPSISSLHLTQPSFFSAHQYVRSSLEQPPALIHRASIDAYNRQRLSIDSLNSGANAPTRNQRSLTSYLPFMGDRDRKLPGSPVGDWPHQNQNQQLRHLIRSIFKSSEPNAVDDDEEPFTNGMLPEDLEEEDALGEMTDGTPKKAKRPRRGLFNRFKTTKAAEMDSKLDGIKLDVKQDASNADLIKQESHSSLASRDSANQNSLPNSNQGSNPNSLHPVNSNLSQIVPGEPDYGALFHGVGKRRNLVGMKNKKGVKSETIKGEEKGEVAPPNERVSLSFVRTSQDYHSGDSKLAQSVQLSQISTSSASASVSASASLSGDGGNQDGTSSFASASKRILGSRLLKRKASTRVAEPQSDVVEIDLQSLDLPPSTEIMSEINTKNRTRGRKENKAADMEDQSKIYVCGYCSRRFKRQEHLKRHFRSLHTTEKPYECPICLKKFSRTDNLNQHLKVHKQEEEAAAAAAAANGGEFAMGES